MANFEEVGRRIDAELKELRKFFETELKPTTQKKAAAALRKAARSLDRAAKEIESRRVRERS